MVVTRLSLLTILLVAAVTFAWPRLLIGTERMSTTATVHACKKASFEAFLPGGQPYARDLGGGLLFRLRPMNMSADEDQGGWTIMVTPKDNENHDYAYPLNPPLRFANSQWLATGYGISVREQLSQVHDVRFILNAAEYERIDKLMLCVLWPCQAPKPNETAQQYLDTIAHAPSGLVHLVAKKFETSADGTSVNWIRFAVTVVVPSDFKLAPELKSKTADCLADVHAQQPGSGL